MTEKNNLYLSIFDALKRTTNLTKIRKDLNISKQNLNNYIRELRKNGLIMRKGRGYYEVVNRSKQATKYGDNLPKDFIRGHAYVWNIKLPKEIKDWDKRTEILEERGINYKLVGILKQTPRIKALGRKIWLCNDHIRVFDKKDASYYGENAIESRKKAFIGLLEIVSALENKLGFIFRPFEFEWKKEHYALIKNDLAIEQNKKGIIWRISDKEGEWLLVDDSLEEGGELENIGKHSFKTNIPMQKWWNDNKKTKFEVTPKFVLNTMNGIQQNQLIFAENMKSHIKAVQDLSSGVISMNETIKELKEEIKRIGELNNEKDK